MPDTFEPMLIALDEVNQRCAKRMNDAHNRIFIGLRLAAPMRGKRRVAVESVIDTALFGFSSQPTFLNN